MVCFINDYVIMVYPYTIERVKHVCLHGVNIYI
jgi:hypothetical protein